MTSELIVERNRYKPHIVSLLQWQQTYNLFTEYIDNTYSEPTIIATGTVSSYLQI